MTLRTRILVLMALVVLAGVATASVLHASARADRKNQTQPGGPSITAGTVALATRVREPHDLPEHGRARTATN